MTALYNEIEPFAAAWMRELIAKGHIAPGVVNEQSIAELTASDVAGPGQRHFFAGIGVWSYALRLAGVPDDASIWTGSCPCQPFSGAGKRGGFSDARHLWPVWFELIRECRPAIVFGEQVASPDGLAWLDAVSSDLEGAGYAFAAADLCAAGVGAPHIRQRLYFVADARSRRQSIERTSHDIDRRNASRNDANGCRSLVELVDSDHRNVQRHDRAESRPQGGRGDEANDHDAAPPGPTNAQWRECDWLTCTDGRHRPVEPSTRPLAHGTPTRVGRLRAYGNAIVAPQAAAFIEAALGALP